METKPGEHLPVPSASDAAQPSQEGPTLHGHRARFTGWKKWVLRLLLLFIVPVLTVALLEGGLRLFGYGYDTSFFVSAPHDDLYMSNARFGWRFFGPEISRLPLPILLSPNKPQNTYRIFVFGESAALGLPFPSFSFARMLEAMLNDRFPDTRFEVVNTGMTAINSHAVLDIAAECKDFSPDAYVVYLGNNEVIGPYGLGGAFGSFVPSRRAIRSSMYLRSTRVGQLTHRVGRALIGGGSQPKEWRGVGMFRENPVTANDPRLETIYDNFRSNLDALCGEAHRAGANVIVSTILTNLKDCPPFLSTHRPGLADRERTRWDEQYNKGLALEAAGNPTQAAESYENAAKIDDRFAELHFRLGRCRLMLEQFDAAREAFVRARDLDALRLRADSRINDIIREVAGSREEQGVRLVDVDRITSGPPWTADGIPGSDLLYEHVHLRFKGNYAIACALFRALVDQLPPAVRTDPGDQVEPPSAERCAELMGFTLFSEYAGARGMLTLIRTPPFAAESVDSIKAESVELRSRLTPLAVEQIGLQYNERVKDRPDDILLRCDYAKFLAHTGNLEAAERELSVVLAKHPDDLEHRVSRAQMLMDQGKTDEAIEQYRLAIENNPYDPSVRTHFGLALAKAGRSAESIREFEKAVAIRDDADGHLRLANVLLKNRRPREAAEHFEAAVQLGSESAQAYNGLGVARGGQNRLQDAYAAFKKAVELEPGRALFLFNLARTEHLLGDEKEAKEHYRRAVELDPQFSAPRYRKLMEGP